MNRKRAEREKSKRQKTGMNTTPPVKPREEEEMGYNPVEETPLKNTNLQTSSYSTTTPQAAIKEKKPGLGQTEVKSGGRPGLRSRNKPAEEEPKPRKAAKKYKGAWYESMDDDDDDDVEEDGAAKKRKRPKATLAPKFL
jgi:hypothetical protein